GEARLPVAVIKPRVFLSDDLSIEGVYVPAFRPARFDRLAESSSPFNVIPPARRGQRPEGPQASWKNSQGGARLNATTGRVDWSLSAYRGFEAFELYELTPTGLVPASPRRSLSGGEFK